jgi:hypothetical protein
MLQDVWRPIRINIKFIWKSGRNEKRSRKVHLISDLPALDYSGGDLVRDERSLASHLLLYPVQVLSTHIHIKQCLSLICFRLRRAEK